MQKPNEIKLSTLRNNIQSILVVSLVIANHLLSACIFQKSKFSTIKYNDKVYFCLNILFLLKVPSFDINSSTKNMIIHTMESFNLQPIQIQIDRWCMKEFIAHILVVQSTLQPDSTSNLKYKQCLFARRLFQF